MSKKCILGSIIHSVQFGSVEVIKEGALIFNESGVIEALLDASLPSSKPIIAAIEPSNIINHSNKLIIPGFVDAHCHAPQYYFTGTGVDMDLMQWLETYTFPVEARFKDLEFASKVYEKSVKRHLKSGTTFASYYATIHKPAALALTEIIEKIGQRAFVGKVAMDRNSPEILIESTENSVDETEDFARQVLNHTTAGRDFLAKIDNEVSYDSTSEYANRPTLLNHISSPLVLPCITPRFVPTCTAESMSGLGKISHKYGLPVQSHLSESLNEIAFVKSLHPEATTYAGVYEVNGLLHKGAIMGHSIHCSDEELALLKRTDTAVVNCASSNFLLGSGIMDVRRFVEAGIRVGLGTDVAGGASASMLDCMRNTLSASRAMGFRSRQDGIPPSMNELDLVDGAATSPYKWLNTNEVFHLATQGGAEALGMGDVVGNFTVGKKLDCVVVDVNAEDSPIDTFGEENVYNLFEKFVYIGDDRNIAQVLVNGRVVAHN